MTRLVRIQLVIFLVLTLVGVSYAGAQYAGIADRLFSDRTYDVTVDLAESGGIFEGAEVSYRGIAVGRVEELKLAPSGVRVRLELRSGTRVPSDTLAVVENRSAIGEQYVDLQPRRKGAPYLRDGSTIAKADTRTPLQTTVLLRDLDRLVESVDKKDLVVVIDELGKAFWGTGDDLGRLIDSGNSLIESADANLAQTVQLIRDSRTVLQTQKDSASDIGSFAKDLADLSDTLVEADPQLRKVLDEGVATAEQLDGLMTDLEGDLPILLGNLVTTGQVVSTRLDGVKTILIVYPYNVRGGYTVMDKDPGTGRHTAHFGLQLALGPSSCLQGYGDTNRRVPEDEKGGAANENARCTEDDTNHRGAQNGPRPGEKSSGRGVPSALDDRAPEPAAKDDPDAPAAAEQPGGSVVQPARVRVGSGAMFDGKAGKESWKWLMTAPLTQ